MSIIARNKYPQVTVQRILDVSLKLFLEKGYEQTTVLDIVGKLEGLSRGAFYHHFKSKEDVLKALSERFFIRISNFDKIRKESHLNGLQKIRELINLQIKYETANITRMMPMLENPRFLAELLKSNQNIIAPLIRDFFEEGIKDGSIITNYPKPLSELMVLITNFWLLPCIFPCSLHEYNDKLILSKNLFDSIGTSILDEETISNMNRMNYVLKNAE